VTDHPDAIAEPYRKQGEHNLKVHAEAQRRRGRPPKAPEDLQTERVTVRLTEAQAKRLDELRGDESRSAWLARPLRD